ncbi:T9SS type A sorting domain-containing protein [Hyunsoonleella pacifica]|uniref:T9SS type A sorting domain-containing protein n=1 Tax=Hyunsoonleella pacifica TaxID=1080224 RepID=A0A4Q9FN75_9FLAO|nr:T9SS type A sorting domain-containing protein [Hyunsoonleella pacifica]TBN15690.1 T9SS type A sorting domain-containing protein [Hyunsoonleella pacifica]GGD21837.1 T9SS C-terminal target domain-containing protein [Hyunsoonleella pacifica]
MKNIYFLLFFIGFLGLSIENGFAQGNPPPLETKLNIEELFVYPNPVSDNASTIYITSKNKFAFKEVTIYNVLGKQIKATVTTRKELDISSLNSGVYILKITEESISETRKLVIK